MTMTATMTSQEYHAAVQLMVEKDSGVRFDLDYTAPTWMAWSNGVAPEVCAAAIVALIAETDQNTPSRVIGCR